MLIWMMLCSMTQSDDEIQTFIFVICFAPCFVRTANLDNNVDSDQTKMQLLIAQGGVCVIVYTLCACVWESSANKFFPESRDEEALALATDLWADRTGLGAHSRRMGKSHSALWVHVFLPCLDKPDKTKRAG